MDRLHEELKFVVPKWTYSDDVSDGSDDTSINTSDETNETEVRNLHWYCQVSIVIPNL